MINATLLQCNGRALYYASHGDFKDKNLMCGFSGFLTLKADLDDSPGLLRRMGDAIYHRGPDDNGEWFDGNAGIGFSHRRLAIIDVSAAGHQPMASPCDRYVIAFNGEIYNHLELRSRLANEGRSFCWAGHSDTETLLACFSAWGIESTLRATVGMFAIALWDRETRVLTLARDRMGEKPLYWGWQDGVLLFGSELKCLKVHPAFKAQISRNALALLMRYNYIPAPYSIYTGIAKLLPGHYLQLSAGPISEESQPIPFWEMNVAVEAGIANPFNGTEEQAIDALESELVQGIGRQMLADVPLGAFLSGGVDSSTIVALMQKQSSRPVKTFTIGFHESGYNEAEHALEVARHLGTEHTEIYIQSSDALDVIPRLPGIYSEPFADSSQIPTYLVSHLAKQQVTVALSGDGGDELFGGYNPYQFAPRMWGVFDRLPLSLRGAAASVMGLAPLPGKMQKLLEVMGAPDREEFYRRLLSHWQHPNQLVLGAFEPPTLLNSKSSWPSVDNYQNWMMAMDAKTYMTDDILVKVDRAAMANSLETRVPMLDHQVVELSWRLPLSMKIRDGKGKWILREVLYRHVPREMIERPKKGFSVPIASWLRGPLRDWAETLLQEQRLKKEGYFNSTIVRKAWSDHLTGKANNSTKLWSILMFQAWLEAQSS
ncbi:asparagine synthase (glutamine-hydrolyzing) [Pseudomonas kilonensis]|nr:asparagine synthase (glutamine-hydrolyzing) [Pseudomonas kilonensis]